MAVLRSRVADCSTAGASHNSFHSILSSSCYCGCEKKNTPCQVSFSCSTRGFSVLTGNFLPCALLAQPPAIPVLGGFYYPKHHSRRGRSPNRSVPFDPHPTRCFRLPIRDGINQPTSLCRTNNRHSPSKKDRYIQSQAPPEPEPVSAGRRNPSDGAAKRSQPLNLMSLDELGIEPRAFRRREGLRSERSTN